MQSIRQKTNKILTPSNNNNNNETKNGFKHFCKGDKNIEDQSCLGRPSAVDDGQKKDDTWSVLLTDVQAPLELSHAVVLW